MIDISIKKNDGEKFAKISCAIENESVQCVLEHISDLVKEVVKDVPNKEYHLAFFMLELL